MQAIGAAKPPLGVIFDADLGNTVDAVLALAVLYGMDGKNECRVVATTVSKHCLTSAAMAEVIARFYAGTVSADFGAVGRGLPVGMSIAGKSPESTPLLDAVLGRKNPEGKPVYNHGILQLNDTADVHAVLRNAYTSQYDQNCVTVLAGPANNLAGVLSLPGAKELIKQKTRALVWAPDRLGTDPAAAQKLLAEWPAPLYIVIPRRRARNQLRLVGDPSHRRRLPRRAADALRRPHRRRRRRPRRRQAGAVFHALRSRLGHALTPPHPRLEGWCWAAPPAADRPRAEDRPA
ncbi:MAG: hypothetical protein NTX13_15530 [Acidobacteria bacterium]|nr:hypothetical protein [Acidobacteriota bacterium]